MSSGLDLWIIWFVLLFWIVFMFSVSHCCLCCRSWGFLEGEGEAAICVVCSHLVLCVFWHLTLHVCVWVFVVDYLGGFVFQFGSWPGPPDTSALDCWVSLNLVYLLCVWVDAITWYSSLIMQMWVFNFEIASYLLFNIDEQNNKTFLFFSICLTSSHPPTQNEPVCP